MRGCSGRAWLSSALAATSDRGGFRGDADACTAEVEDGAGRGDTRAVELAPWPDRGDGCTKGGGRPRRPWACNAGSRGSGGGRSGAVYERSVDGEGAPAALAEAGEVMLAVVLGVHGGCRSRGRARAEAAQFTSRASAPEYGRERDDEQGPGRCLGVGRRPAKRAAGGELLRPACTAAGRYVSYMAASSLYHGGRTAYIIAAPALSQTNTTAPAAFAAALARQPRSPLLRRLDRCHEDPLRAPSTSTPRTTHSARLLHTASGPATSILARRRRALGAVLSRSSDSARIPINPHAFIELSSLSPHLPSTADEQHACSPMHSAPDAERPARRSDQIFRLEGATSSQSRRHFGQVVASPVTSSGTLLEPSRPAQEPCQASNMLSYTHSW
ncbi:hypothetical protein BDV95DRAFT_640311 [Massariosphaeria phaeospora]|uniref:Uncharacterized protein n=1 Tax=Massariosphaeria phaeospora TaxID=100035 RepID=A0A7C8I3D1_9PLEO|nr:hypothetical protein BDV95DRAFT_640311 [Massariosphaeria phaeospora]